MTEEPLDGPVIPDGEQEALTDFLTLSGTGKEDETALREMFLSAGWALLRKRFRQECDTEKEKIAHTTWVTPEDLRRLAFIQGRIKLLEDLASPEPNSLLAVSLPREGKATPTMQPKRLRAVPLGYR